MLLHSSCWVSQIPSLLRYACVLQTNCICIQCFHGIGSVCVCVSVSVCVELIVSSLCCLHSVYSILILSIPSVRTCSRLFPFLTEGSREVMAYTIECCWGKLLVYVCCCILNTHKSSVSCVSLQPLEIVQRS
jgi:hypothetical protein